jgi:hypothetical protein
MGFQPVADAAEFLLPTCAKSAQPLADASPPKYCFSSSLITHHSLLFQKVNILITVSSPKIHQTALESSQRKVRIPPKIGAISRQKTSKKPFFSKFPAI